MNGVSFASKSFPPASLVIAAAVTAVSLLAASRASSDGGLALVVRYPAQGQAIGSVSESFAFGSAAPGSIVTVNGKRALIAPDGAWSAYVPFESGTFVLHVIAIESGQRTEVDRTVSVAAPGVRPFPDMPTIVQPRDPIVFEVTARGAAHVSALLPGFGAIALHRSEQLGADGFGALVRSSHPVAQARVTYRIENADGSSTNIISASTLEIAASRTLYVGQVIPYSPDPESGTRPYGMFFPAPDSDTTFTMPVGTPLDVIARRGDVLEVALGSQLTAWTDRQEVGVAPAGTPALPPRSRASVSTRAEQRQTDYTIALAGRAPVRIDEDPSAATLAVTIFGAGAGGADDTVTLAPHQRTLWGYRAYWAGSDLEIDVKRPPLFAIPPSPALAGLLVVVDPGHSPDTGAVGPLGTLERDVNLDIARRLASKLRSLGARVVMTRSGDEPVRLYDRPLLAERLDADVLISVHNNAPPDGVDPANNHGYSVYYFQPHSLALAQSIHAAYGRDTDLPDAGLRRGDLALVRTPALPAVLTESAFVTWPWEEMKLRDPAYRARLAATMAEGMERWAETQRSIENRGAR